MWLLIDIGPMGCQDLRSTGKTINLSSVSANRRAPLHMTPGAHATTTANFGGSSSGHAYTPVKRSARAWPGAGILGASGVVARAKEASLVALAGGRRHDAPTVNDYKLHDRQRYLMRVPLASR